MKGQLADIANASNVNDVRLAKLSWIYDLYYPSSKKLFLKKKYIEKTMAALPPLPELARLGKHLTEYINQNI
jgi:hypothetical protein